MSGQRYSVTIDVGANISSARLALSELQRLFGKNFSLSGNKLMFNLFGGLEKALDELETKSSKAITSLALLKELDNARKKVMDFFDAILTESKKISSLGGTDFAKRLEGLGTLLSSAAKAWSTYLSSVKAAMKEQDSLTNKKDNLTTTLENLKKALADLLKELDKYVGRNNEISKARSAETKAKNESAAALKDLTAAKSAETRARKLYENYITTEKLIKDAQGKIDEKASKKNLGFIDSSAITIAKLYYNEIVKIQKALDKKTDPADKISLEKSLADKTTQYEDFLKANNLLKNALGGVDEAAASLFNKSISQKIEEALNLYKLLEIKANEVKAKQKEFDSKEKIATGKTADVTALEGKKSEIESKIADLQNAISKTEADLKQALTAFDDFFKAGKDTAAFDKLKEDLRNLFGDDFVKDMQNTELGLENIKQKIESIGGDKIAQAKQDLESFNNSLSNGQLGNDLDKINNKFALTGELVLRAEQLIKEIEHIKSRIQYFFGLANAINLVKRAIRSSFNTVKELDKAMTETAVVTDYTIKDMWKLLPEYTKRANQLGVTTKEAYESATLYYQLGLNTEQAAALSTETLKMARIAGLDAADATDRMTNALRGFNMELNATLAQRVDDVYSQLAAMSASNVDEISTAMTKVASLANNANMEFETTAAFLAQIIETTRESAETAGTALKTVVARFSEVKKLVDADLLKGQDEEGLVIDVNKVSLALRTAGIDLNKYFLGEVGLDDIFMELASKWDSLTNIQLRYIATQAAGSRQQSRFIALMADYKRTQELVGAAYDSNGASEKQFEKTQDSMQSKLARLKNAWDEFAMGLANNAVLKGVVDALTTLLQIINKVTSAFGNGVGSVLKWTAAISALSGVRKLFVGGGFVDKALGTVLNGTIFGKGLFEKGILSGFLFGGKHVEGSKAQEILLELAANGGGTTVIPRTSLLSDIFNGNLKKKIVDFKDKHNIIKGLAYEDIPLELWNIDPEYAESLMEDTRIGTSLFDALGNSFLKTKFGSAISTKVGALFGKEALSGAATLGVTLGGIAVAVGTIVAAYAAWSEFSLEGLLKLAKKYSELMDKVATAAEEAKRKTLQVLEQYQEKATAVQEAETVLERNKAILERNDYLSDLLLLSNKYAQYISSTFENGQLVLTLDEASISALALSTAEGAAKASANAELAKAMVAGKQAAVYEKKYQNDRIDLANKRIYEGIDEHGFTSWRDMTAEEVARYTLYLNLAALERVVEKGYAKTAFARMLNTLNLSDEMSDAVASAMAETFNSDDFFKSLRRLKRIDWWSGNATTEQLQNRYRELYGVEAETTDKKELALAVASAEVIKDTYTNLIKEISAVSKEDLGLKLLQVISGTYEGSLKNIGAELSGLLTNEDIVKTLMEMFGTEDTTGLAKILNTYIELIEKTRKEYAKNALKSLMSSGLRDTKVLTNFSKLEIAQLKKVIKIGETLADYGNNFRNQVETAMIDAMSSEGGIGTELDSFIGSLSDNIILTFLAIKDGSNSANKEVLNLANSLKSTGEEEGIFSRLNLVQFYLTTSEFEDLNELIESFIEENGKITPYNIQELAKESKSLAVLLDNDIISANGLAKAFLAFSKGNITITDLNENVLKVLDSFEGLTDIVSRALNFIKNFDPGEDWGESFDFIESAINSMEELISSRELGNPQLLNYWKAIFTTTPDDLEGWERGIEILKTLQEWNGGRFWTNVMGASLDEETGVMTNMGAEGLTSKEYRALMLKRADAYTKANNLPDFTEDYLNMQFLNMANHDYGIVKELAANDVKAIAEIYKETFGDAKPSLADIQAIADGLGITPLLVLDAYNEKYGSNLLFKELAEKVVRDISESFKEIKESGKYGETAKEIINSLGIKDGQFDIGTLKANVKEIVPEVQNGSISAEDWINLFIGSEGITVPISYLVLKEENGQISFDSKTTDVTVKNIEELETIILTILDNANSLNAAALVGDLEDAKKAADELIETIKTENKVTLDYSAINDAITYAGQLQASLSTDASKTVTITEVYKTGGNTSGSNKAGREYPNNDWSGPGSAAGGIVSYASGARRVKPGVALTGEEGPELVWNKNGGYAYLVGKHGPEFANLVPGDLVFPADETKDIINRGVTPSLAKGGKITAAGVETTVTSNTIWSPGDNNGKGSGSDQDKEKLEEFKMDLDKYYNMVEDINELLRLRNLLEKDYELLLKNEGKTGKEIYDNLNRLLKLLEERSKIVADLAEKRKLQIIDEVAANQEYQKYAWWNNEDLTIEIDWDLVTSITDKDEGGKVKDYLSKLEDFQSKYDDMIEQLEEIEDTIQDIRERGKDLYNTLEERVRDALIKQIQDKIDELLDVDKAINDTNQKLFDSMQETLSMLRQQRDNAKTEEGLTDKEKRLAYLQLDSSNANALEIAKLQEELADERQNYTDTLIDQKISELQLQNDLAQEQRQEQIELMQRSLDWQEKSGAFWETVYQYISEGTDAIGALVKLSELERLLMSAEPWDKLSEELKLNWVNDLMDLVAQGIAYLEMLRLLEDIGTKEGTSISFTNANGLTLTGKADKNGNVVVTNSDGSTITYKDVFLDYHGAYRTFETSGEVKAAPKPVTSTAKPTTSVSSGNGNSGSRSTGSENTENNKKFKEFKYVNYGNADSHKVYRVYTDNSEELVGTEGHSFEFRGVSADNRIFVCSKCSYKKTVKNDSAYIGSTGKTSGNSTELILSFPFSGSGGGGRVMLRYASGGLNTQAGPAWLDGTASNPELVLNARDTQNFIELKDVLADMRKNGGFSLTGGDNYYNISVNVDLMSSDYDVDRAIDRIKARIAQDGAYRNVNTLSRLR